MDAYVGTIFLFAGGFAPKGWAICDGRTLSIFAAENGEIFSIIGTDYGGDGRNTFALPDLRGRVPVGAGEGPGLPPVLLGDKDGEASHTLTPEEIPAHSHSLNAVSEAGNTGAPANNFLANTGILDPDYRASGTAVDLSTSAISQAGENQAHNNMQPYLGLNYIICITGTFPPRP